MKQLFFFQSIILEEP